MLRLRNRELVEDALQRLRAKLLIGPNPRIATYRGRGSLSGWLAIAVARVAIELRRADRSGREPPAGLCSSSATYDPDLTQHMLAERYRDSFSVALHAAVRDLSPADRDLLRRSFVDGCSVDRLGSIYSIHRATAARRLNKARDRLVAAMRRKVLVRHRFSEDDFDSIARDVSEHLDFSCEGIFGERSAS